MKVALLSDLGKRELKMTRFWLSLGVTEKADGTVSVPREIEAEIRAFHKARPSLSITQAVAAWAHQKKAAVEIKPGEITPAQLTAVAKAFDAEQQKNPFLSREEVLENVRRKTAWSPFGVKVI